MRNVIKFQTATEEDYEHFKNSLFCNELIFLEKREELVEVCLSHALTKVVKSHELVHNIKPFLQWIIIEIDTDGFTEGQNPFAWRRKRDPRTIEYIQRNLFIVAAFSNSLHEDFFGGWTSYYLHERQLFSDIHLDDLLISDADYLESLHKSSWRRVYANNLCLFSCLEKDIAAYVKEQTRISKPIDVFKQIINRELGEHFDQFEVLESIASPYYYVLPPQDEREYNEFESMDSWLQTTNSTLYLSFSFDISLIIGEKTLM
ncbi:uncharacterized protein TNCT_241711 [Trichonephila clavata]|uniref:Uncharacterized protein n=1 Tax=Trichonephila clavata TaxID=2740835 RepID=A0A8X6FFN3_TRICU|nr:uncharacterized protein TNCT_241711 [Trichonephila clavata]